MLYSQECLTVKTAEMRSATLLTVNNVALYIAKVGRETLSKWAFGYLKQLAGSGHADLSPVGALPSRDVSLNVPHYSRAALRPALRV